MKNLEWTHISHILYQMWTLKVSNIIRPYQAISSQSSYTFFRPAMPCPYHAPPVDQQEIGIFRASAFSVCREGSGASSQSLQWLQWLERSVFSDCSFHVNPGIPSFQIQFHDLENNVAICCNTSHVGIRSSWAMAKLSKSSSAPLGVRVPIASDENCICHYLSLSVHMAIMPQGPMGSGHRQAFEVPNLITNMQDLGK